MLISTPKSYRVFKPALLVLLCYLQLPSFAALADTKPRKLSVGVSMRPVYQYVDNNGKFAGLDVELSQAIFEQAGFEITFVALPWKRIVFLLEHGELDVALSAADSDERKVFAYFSEEYLRFGHTVLFARKEDKHKFDPRKTLNQLKDMEVRLGAIHGVSYSLEFDKLASTPWFKRNLFTFGSYERLLELLLIGRLDAYLGSEFGQLSLINQKQLQGKVVPVFYLMSDIEAQTHVMYSKKSVPYEWVKLIDQSIAEFRATDAYRKIVQKYQVPD